MPNLSKVTTIFIRIVSIYFWVRNRNKKEDPGRIVPFLVMFKFKVSMTNSNILLRRISKHKKDILLLFWQRPNPWPKKYQLSLLRLQCQCCCNQSCLQYRFAFRVWQCQEAYQICSWAIFEMSNTLGSWLLDSWRLKRLDGNNSIEGGSWQFGSGLPCMLPDLWPYKFSEQIKCFHE